jgi:hypothetical protein
MKRIFLLLFILLSFKSFSQVNVVGYITTQGVALYPTHYDSMGFAGYRVAKDTTERDAITCLRRKFGMAVYVQSVNKIYILKDSSCNNVWEQFSSGGSSIDTTSLSNRINSKADTNSVKLKLNASDTINYLKKTDTTNKFVNWIGKNANKDSILFYIGGTKYGFRDSSSSNIGTGTVTSISQGYGISNSTNPITTTGTISVDSATLSAKYVRINDTLNMLSGYIDMRDTSSMLSAYPRKSTTIATTSPLSGGGSLNGNLTLSMPSAAAGVSGYLSGSDWATFNSKANNTISINATLGSGANLSGGGNLTTSRVIVIPKATTSVDGYLSATDYTSFAAKQNSLSPVSPIEINSSLLSIRKASATDSGYLSAADWNTFNNKLNTSDTTNKFVNSVTKLNDSTIRVIKGTSTTDITLTPSATVTAATRLVTTAYNNSGATIAKGSVVYINGRHSSNYPTIALSEANNEANSYKTFALVQSDITNGSTGTIIQAGNISNLNLPTSTYTDGDIVYLSPTVAGGITNIKPLAPYHICKIGSVTRAHPTQGSIEIKIENGWQLDELSDVQIAAVPLDSTILQFSRVDSLWHDVNPTTAMGNRFVRNISRVAGKDSIIFTIGSTRYAIKDSVGGGGSGTPAGSNGYVQFNNSGSFGADSSLFWNNTNKRLGVGTTQPQNKLDVIKGNIIGGMNRGEYESSSFTNNGDNKLGIYNAGNFTSGGSSITFGSIKNKNSAGYYPGFEFQNANDSTNPENSLMRYNYIQRNDLGQVANATLDLMNIYANGKVAIDGSNFYSGLTVNPRLVIGNDNTGEAMLETSGSGYINGTLTTTSRVKHINSIQDDGNANYYVQSNDHIIIIYFSNNNVNIHLPENPPDGREIIIKAWGFLDDYYTSIYASGDNEIVVGNTYYDSTQPVDILHNTEPNSMTLIYNNSIGDGVWFILNGQVQ